MIQGYSFKRNSLNDDLHVSIHALAWDQNIELYKENISLHS